MKRTLLLTFLFPLFALASFAKGVQIDNLNYLLDESGKTATVTYPGAKPGDSFNSSSTIPSTVTYNGNTYTVTAVGDSAFYGCVELFSIKIPSTIRTIGQAAFMDCQEIMTIEIPASVSNIGRNAFWGCYNVVEIKVDANNRFYDSRDNCNAIIRTATNRLVAGCKFTEIPETVVEIAEGAFGGCAYLSTVTIPSSVTRIVSNAFMGCIRLTTVTINSNAIVSGCSELVNGSSLVALFGSQVKKYVIGEGVEAIGGRAFFAGQPEQSEAGPVFVDNALETVVLPSTLRTIGRWAFQYCTNLRSVNIPEGVDSIADGAFTWCHSLEALNLPSTLRVPGEGHNELFKVSAVNVAEGNPYLRSEDGVLLSADGKTLWLYPSGKVDEAYRIPDGVEEIRGYAFDGTTKLRSLTLPASLKSVGSYTFSNVSSIEDIVVEAAEPPAVNSALFFDWWAGTWLVPSGYNFYDTVTLRVPRTSREPAANFMPPTASGDASPT
ncbi:MAG: leucine-rich repeat domain-containing protein [Bacteroidaceae bacterium]|nr:leucine-rich repeat domain-containing protein [Bacteroidaceae bacterium]